MQEVVVWLKKDSNYRALMNFCLAAAVASVLLIGLFPAAELVASAVGLLAAFVCLLAYFFSVGDGERVERHQAPDKPNDLLP